MTSIVLGGGCFWCLEASFKMVHGVSNVISGYTGGHDPAPTYDSVLTGRSGHIEVVQVTFDEEIITLEKILSVFWLIHDPTSRDKQGSDVGEQYRSVIFYSNDLQHTIVKESFKQAQAELQDRIVTQVSKLETFFPAEDYHQNYFENNPDAGYCQVVINPKLEKLRRTYANLLS